MTLYAKMAMFDVTSHNDTLKALSDQVLDIYVYNFKFWLLSTKGKHLEINTLNKFKLRKTTISNYLYFVVRQRFLGYGH